MTHKQRPLLDEQGMHLTTVHGVRPMREACPVCGKPDTPGQSHLNSERTPGFVQKQASASALIFAGAFHVRLAYA